MTDKDHTHYSSKYPDVPLEKHSISVSLRRHLYIFKTLTGVFSYEKLDLGTEILIRNLIIPEEPKYLLDLGCGYGPIGIVLGYETTDAEIFMMDINRRAVWCAKENIKINLPQERDRIKAFAGNYFEPFKKKEIKFDAIYMNPPIREGREEFFELIEDIIKYLNPKGFFQFVIRKKLGASYVEEYLQNNYSSYKTDIIAKRSGYWIFIFYKKDPIIQ
ncbi:MAG: class I SAM-dependent methyltransferase [Promethearchaeia archaeon]